MALAIAHVRIPTQFPIAERNAALLPPKMDCLSTMATPWPGTITSRSVAKAKAGILSSN